MFLGRVNDDVVADRRCDEDPDSVHLDNLVTFHGISDEVRPNLATGDAKSNRNARRRQF